MQVFSETRHERRDGLETFGYGTIDPTSAAATAHPELANVVVPFGIIGLETEEKRLELEIHRGILPSDPTDSRNTIIEIRAGAGGARKAAGGVDPASPREPP